jgi:hypothetical protein
MLPAPPTLNTVPIIPPGAPVDQSPIRPVAMPATPSSNDAATAPTPNIKTLERMAG